MTYTAHRDYRFEYATDAIAHVEETQCFNCVYRKDDSDEFTMCVEFEIACMLEETIEEWDDVGDEGLICNKREKSFT